MKIAHIPIGEGYPCFLVAEAALTHNGIFQNALRLIDMASAAGFDAIKFQIYKTEELWSEERASEWYARFKKKELPYENFKKLKEYAEKQGIIWFATPHTQSAFEYLQTIDPPCYKIGSGEQDTKFIDKVANTGKPLIISTGLRAHYDVMNLIDRYGNNNTAFLHCVTAYPTNYTMANLRFIESMKNHCEQYNAVVGYSDHTPGSYACELATAMGASIIEKHICLEDSEGQDVLVSLNSYNKLENFVKAIRLVEDIRGSFIRQYSDREKENEKWALKNQSDGRRPL